MKLSALPRPPGSIVHQVLEFGRDPLATLPRWSRELGDRVLVDMPGLPTVILSHPDDANAVLVRDHARYRKDYWTGTLKDILGNGLLTNEGESWRKQRRLAQPAFHAGAIAGYADTMAALADDAADRWGPRAEIDAHGEMMRLTLDIVARTLFGHDIGRDAARIAEGIELFTRVYRGVGGSGIRMPLWVPTPTHRRARRAIRDLDAVMFRILADHRRHPDPGTLLGMLIAATDEDGATMDDRQLRDEAITLLMAGHETTANALAMTFYLLSQHPEVEERLHAELDGVLGGRAPTLADLAALPWNRAVVLEAMRLYPPAWAVGREAAVDTTLDDLEIPAGTQLWISQWVMQRDPRWFDEPLAFRPERWLDGALEKRLPRGAYVPFSAGPRVCIGKRFAQMEAELVTAALARRVSFRLAPGETLRLNPSITLRPEGGLAMTATARPSGLRRAA